MCIKQLVLSVLVLLLAMGVNGQNQSKYRASDAGDDGFSQSGIPFSVSANGTAVSCVGSTAEFQVRVKGTEAYRFVWKKLESAGWREEGRSTLQLRELTLAQSGHYYCEVSDVSGKVTVNSDTMELKVYEMPEVTLTVDDNKTRIAYGDSVHFQVSGDAEDYQWNVTVPESYWVKPAITTTYTVTGKNGDVCRTEKSVTIEVVKLYVNVGPNIQMSAGQTRSLNVETNADTVFWYAKPLNEPTVSRMRAMAPPSSHPEWGTLIGGGSTLSVSPAVSTVYTAVAYLNGYSAVGSVINYVKSPGSGYRGGDDDGFTQSDIPFGITPLNDTTFVCQDDSVTLTVNAKGVSVYDYEWFKVASPDISVKNANSCTIRDCDFPQEGEYYCKVTDRLSGFYLFSDTTYLYVNERPKVEIYQPARRDTLICSGDTIFLMTHLSPAPTRLSASDVTYTWAGNKVVWGENSSTSRVAPLVKTDYIVTAESKGCSTKDTITVDVNTPYVDLPTTMIVGEHSDVKIYARDKSGNIINPATTNDFEWGVNTSIVESGTSASNPLTINNIQQNIEKAWVTVKFGDCEASDSTYFKMKVGVSFLGGIDDGFTASCLDPTILETFGQKKLACQENVENPVADSVILRIVYEGSDIEFHWEKRIPGDVMGGYGAVTEGNGITGVNGPILKFKPLNVSHNGSYRCILKNNCSDKTDTAFFTVSVKGEPVILSSTNNGRIRCKNDMAPFTYNVIAEGATPDDIIHFQWYKDGQILTGDTNNYLTKSLLTVDNLDGSGNYVSPAGMYVLKIWNDCGAVYDTANLIVNEPAYIARPVSDTTIYACEGDRKEFAVQAGGGGNYEYELREIDVNCTNYNEVVSHTIRIFPGLSKVKIPVSSSGKYVWRVKNECSKGEWAYSPFIYLKIDKKPSFVTVPRDQDLCVGDVLDLECEASSDTRNLFYWEKDNVLIPGQTTNRLRVYNVKESDAGVYRCFVYNDCNPIPSDAIIVKVSDKPLLTSISGVEQDYCQGDTVLMKANISTLWPLDSIRWHYKGAPLYDDAAGHITGSGTPLLQINGVQIADAEGAYYIELINSCGSSTSQPISFKLKQPAAFVRGLDHGVDLFMCTGTSQNLYVEATGTPPIRYIWLHDGDTVANGNTSYLPIRNAQVDTAGEYVCHVQNSCGDDITKTFITVVRSDTFRLVGGGHYCAGESGLTATLKGSDTTTLYRLYKKNRSGVTSLVKEIHGRDVVPLRGYIEFKNLTDGLYYVMAVNKKGCEDRMPGEVDIIEDPLPVDYKLYVERHMCEGDLTGDLALPGSQKGVDYYLLKEKAIGWDTVPVPYAGTGSPILMPVGQGFYKVYAVDTASGCSRVLSGLDSITPRPYPQECELSVLNDDSIYCRGTASDVTLTYACFENGSSYTLWKNGHLMNPPKNTAPLTWPNTEEGVYNIRVINKWGCVKNFGRQEVKIQELPERHHLVGARTYCKEEPGDHLLELQDSEDGVMYSFRYLPSTVIKDTLSTGGAIKLRVPLQEHTYYVVATDTTPEHCSVAMLDTVEVRMSRLDVAGNPPYVLVEPTQKAQLNIDITNAEGTPVISWKDPNGHLSDVLTTEDPWTKPWNWGTEDFLVEVSDASGCMVEASVRVIPQGTPLTGDLRLDDCVTSRDTISICDGNEVTLCAYADGGQGYYVYTWSDLNNSNLGRNKLLTYTPTDEGYVWLDIQSSEQKLRDSIYIKLGRSPQVDTVEGPYSRCVTPGNSESIILKNSQPGVTYYLEHSTDGINYTYFAAGQNGTGSQLTFLLPNAADYQGYVRVVAEKISPDGITCPSPMQGVVEIRVAPTRFPVSGGWNYCGNELVRDTIFLKGAQKDVKYHLKREPGTEVAQVTGTATMDSVLFIGKFSEGTYFVTAEIGACQDTMNGRVQIVRDTLPALGNLIGKGNHCVADCPVEIGIERAIPGVNYYFMLDTTGGGQSSTLYTVSTPGKLSQNYCQLGTYWVEAVNPTTGCKNTVKEVIIRETPDIQHFQGDTVYCEGTFGVKLKVDSTELNATYYVQQWDTAGSKWVDMSPKLEFSGNGFPFDISRYFTDGYYRLMSALPCPAAMDSIRIKMIPLPLDTLPLQLIGSACIDSAFVLKIDPRETDVNYTLKYKGANVTQAPTLTATGISWSFTDGEAGTYTVIAEREMCSVLMKDSVTIDSVPNVWPLDGVKQLCENDHGELFMTDYEQGVTYSLYDTTAHRFTVVGTLRNDSIIFPQVKPGTYYLQAARGSCFRNGDLYTIRTLKAPQPVRMDASDCVDAGKGWMLLHDLQDSLEYLITSTQPLGPISLFSGDTLFKDLAVGIYCVTVRDTLLGCESVSVCDTIREGVGVDSLVGDFYYCEGNAGATLTLSGTQMGVDYSILNKNGVPLMKISRPTRVFPNTVQQDTFIFRKERTGYLGGCRIDSVFEVKEAPLPIDTLDVELTGGIVLCAGGNYYVKINGSQTDKEYLLRKQGSTVNLDTVYGNNGQAVTFAKPLSEAGKYRIWVSDTNYGCGVYLDTVLNIAQQPEPVIIDSCIYCYEYGSAANSDSCQIGLRGMQTGTIYRLNNGTEIDTLIGPGNGLFDRMPAGTYKVIAENQLSGCIDTSYTSITAERRPKKLDVVINCGIAGVLDTIYTLQLSEAATDSVVYYLYKDGVRQSRWQVGDGTRPVAFGQLTEPGVYKIYAEKRRSLCGVFMNDSVVITPPFTCTPADTLKINGTFCKGSGSGVTLTYGCSVRGWKYYLKGVISNSDTIAGGGILSWNQIDGHPLWDGKYILVARNACGTELKLDTVDVKGKPAPAKFSIVNNGISLCEGSTFDIILSGSEEGVVYTVERSGIQKASVTAGPGGGPIKVATLSAAGTYTVWGEKNGCKIKMDDLVVQPGLLPAELQILGSDMCLSTSTDSIEICLPRRENKVKYYLYVNGVSLVDSLTEANAAKLCFGKHDVIGRYTVIAQHPTSTCRREMLGAFNLSNPPTVYDFDNPGDTIHICQGMDTCLYMENSQIGINYILKKDGATYGSPAYTTTGGRLKVGCVNTSGVYRVVGKVGLCEAQMNDSVIVQVHKLPDLSVESEIHYCELSGGEPVKVNFPTDSTIRYDLYTPNGTTPYEFKYGMGDKSAFEFDTWADSVGYYRVIATDTATECSQQYLIRVVEDALPLDFDLISSTGNYICADGNGTSTNMSLSGSEAGVAYTLYRLSPREDIITKDGTGGPIQFKSVSDTGVYLVRAENTISHCVNSFSPIHILRADTVKLYELKSIRRSYCSLADDPLKGVIELSGSQLGVEYEVYKDGTPTGLKQMGTGSSLRWTGLEGKLCRSLGYPPKGGYIYAVLGRDTLSGCMKQMAGSDTIVAEERIEILAQEPNEDIAICERDSVQFSVTTSGCGEKYQWYHNGTPIAGETKPYYNIRSLNPMGDPGFYYCEIQNSCGIKETQTVEMTIYPLVKVKQKMEPIVVCNPNEKNILLASAFENAQYHIWYKEGTTEEDALSWTNTYVIEQFDTTMVGKYICKGWNGNKCNTVYDTCEVKMGSVPQVTILKGRDTTLCAAVGNSYELEVRPDPGVTIEWEFNGKATGYTGNLYRIDPVTAAKEGLYAVRATNTCGPNTINVARVFVDDSIRIVSLSDTIMLLCPGESTTLFVTTEPAKRVNYFWYQKPSDRIIGRESSLAVGPMGKTSPMPYRVEYSNRCTSGKVDFTLNVPDTIIADPLPESISFCADCGRDTVLRLNVDASMFAEFKWYYRVNEKDSARIWFENEKADTLPIRVCTSNTGYYYCRVFNRCQTNYTTNTCWVRIDSVPVIETILRNDTICEGLQFSDTLQATGGTLKYSWVVEKKDGSVKQFESNIYNPFVSVDKLTIPDIDATYDSCTITCYVENDCGKDTSNVMLLRVLPALQIQMAPTEQTICRGDSAMVEVELTTGSAPWDYKIKWPDGVERTTANVTDLKDTLWLKQPGTYEMTYINDQVGCIRTHNMPKFVLKEEAATELDFSGGGEVCYGDTVSVNLKLRGGMGPWEVTITDGTSDATEIYPTYPLVLYTRDTTLKFAARTTADYYITSTVRDLGTGCWGARTDSIVHVKVNVPGHIDFANTDPRWSIPQCRRENIRDYLKPQIGGVDLPVGTGIFYVNGRPLGPDDLWRAEDLVGDSCYRVKCEYVDSNGCLVTSLTGGNEVEVCVDSLPHGYIEVSDFACEGIAGDYTLHVYMPGGVDSVIVREATYRRWDAALLPSERVKYKDHVYKASDFPAGGGMKTVALSWTKVPGIVDSCKVFEVVEMVDQHGCHWNPLSGTISYDTLYRDTVWRRWNPEMEFEYRTGSTKALPGGDTTWYIGNRVNIAHGDSVDLHVTLISGQPLWSLPGVGVKHIGVRDTIITLAPERDTTYSLQITDDNCGEDIWHRPTFTITYLDTGYFRGRLWLEGPYDDGNHTMYSVIADSLKLPALTSLSRYSFTDPNLHLIDWVRIELRTGAPVDSVAKLGTGCRAVTEDSCLLLSNGYLLDRHTGDTLVGIRNACGGGTNRYYVVVSHRNHLSVMTKRLFQFIKRSAITTGSMPPYVDFTNASNIYCSSSHLERHMSRLEPNVWGLSGGELNKNFLVSLFDPNRITKDETGIPMLAPTGNYDVLFDVNFDGHIGWPTWNGTSTVPAGRDWEIIKMNRHKFTEILFR